MNYLGIEIGGTKLQLAIGAGDGKLLALWRGSVDVAAGADGIRTQIKGAVPELLQKCGLPLGALGGIGIGFGGPVDDATQTVIRSHQIQGWDNFPLADWIGDTVGLFAALGNDADCAGLAEALFGAGKGLSPIFYITIGSGIGGGLIINGEIYRGCGRGAAEIGHLVTSEWHWGEPGSRSTGPLETGSSGWAIQSEVRENHPLANTPLGDVVYGKRERITVVEIAQAAAQGDEFCQRILSSACVRLSGAICAVIVLLAPRRVVIGGGVSLMGEDLLFEPLRRMVAERVFEPFRDCYDIVPAALGEEVVLHGALALARRRFDASSKRRETR